MLLFGSKVTRVKNNDHADVLLVIQGQDIQSIYQILNEMEKDLGTGVNIRYAGSDIANSFLILRFVQMLSLIADRTR